MTTTDTTLHVLCRATHGPAPADRLAVQALGGVDAWLADPLTDRPDPVCDAQVFRQLAIRRHAFGR